jgi:hypothetical protein
MEKLSIKLKKVLFVTMLLVSGVVFTNVQAQNFKLKVSKDSTLVDGKYTYTIIVKIYGGTAPYNVELYDNLLRDGGKLIAKEENTSLSELRFSNISGDQTIYISVECIVEKQGITRSIKL